MSQTSPKPMSLRWTFLLKGGECRTFNCGYGHGYSVREVLAMLREVAGTDLKVDIGPRRAGDPENVVADPGRIRECLGWRPRYDDLRFMIETSLKWERQLNEMVAR